MENLKHIHGVNPYALLAAHLGLEPVPSKSVLPIFKDKDGKKFVLTEYGYYPEPAIPAKMELEETKIALAKRTEELKQILKKSGIELKEDYFNKKSKKKLRKIVLANDLSPQEKIEKITEYLKIKQTQISEAA